MQVELATGYTWLVFYRFDGEAPEMLLARAITPEIASKEAHYSLETGLFDYQIFGLVREDKRETLA